MSIPSRAELESLKRTALQSKCKELGIKANSKSEVLIDLILEHYQTLSGPSRPSTSTSTKRKAQDDLKARRVKPKIEPQETVLQTSPRRGKVMEVVIRSPAKARGKGKGKAKAQTPVDDETEFVKETTSLAVPDGAPAMPALPPLTATATSQTILDTTAETPTLQDTRIADLELQIRNARKAGDESSRDVLALKAFQHAVQQAFGDATSSDTLDSMGQLAKLRDIAPKLVAASQLDPDALYSRLDKAQQQFTEFEAAHEKNQTEIAELQERLRELETGLPAVLELEASVRQLQSQFNRIPESVFNNTRPEDSASDNRYTIIRPASAVPTAGPSNSQRPSSQLSVPQEEGLFPSQNQDQNNGRAASVARSSSRSSRPPLAQKEEKEAEVETDARRPSRPSSQSQSRPSSQSSRARSIEPYSRGRSSEPPTPSRGKGKSRLIKTSLDTVNEDETSIHDVADPFTPTVELPRSPPAAVRNSASPSPVSKPGPTATFLPPLATLGANGPIAELPFKLIASPSKPSTETISRPAAPSGRVARTSMRPHASSARRSTASESTGAESRTTFNFSLPGASTTATTNGSTNSSSVTAAGGHGFITPERLGANFSLFPPTRIDLGRTPGGLAFKTTGRAPPGTPAVTNTLFGTEVARDTRFADLPYDPDASRGSISWEEGLPVWPAGIPRNAANP